MEGGAYDERKAEEQKSPDDRCCGVRGVCGAGVWLVAAVCLLWEPGPGQELVSAYTAETPLGDRQAEVEQQVQQDLAQMRGTTFFWDVNQIAEIQPEQIVYAMDMGSGDLTRLHHGRTDRQRGPGPHHHGRGQEEHVGLSEERQSLPGWDPP